MRLIKHLFSLILITTLILAGLGYYTSPPHPIVSHHLEVRAAIDIGSGASNLKIAKVDPVTHKIVTEIFKKSIPVAYQRHLELSHDMTFDQEIMDQGMQAMRTFKEIADQHHVKKVVAVATAAFRDAKNAPELAKKMEKETGIKVMIIDQDLEGILGFEAAMATTTADPNNSVVWDIGGGSMQLTAQTPKEEFVVQKETLASVPFKNAMISIIQGKNPKEVTSPNPISETNVFQAYELVKHELVLNSFIAEKIKTHGIEIIGVGNLFKFSVKPLAGAGGNIATLQKLEEGVKGLLNKTDAELDRGHFNEIAVTDPLLILAYMKAMNIEQVVILDVNNADGALSYPPFWAY